MKQRNYIFICKAGHDRSPSAARVAEEISKERGLEARFSYGGIDSLVENIGDLKHYLDFFDGIFVMKENIRQRVLSYGIESFKVIDLDIADIYDFMETELVNILRGKLEKYFQD